MHDQETQLVVNLFAYRVGSFDEATVYEHNREKTTEYLYLVSILMRVKFVVSSVIMTATGLSVPTGVSAGEIALTLKAQDITVVGDFVALEDQTYVIATEAGTIYVPAALATCVGDDCVIVTAAQSVSG